MFAKAGGEENHLNVCLHFHSFPLIRSQASVFFLGLFLPAVFFSITDFHYSEKDVLVVKIAANFLYYC